MQILKYRTEWFCTSPLGPRGRLTSELWCAVSFTERAEFSLGVSNSLLILIWIDPLLPIPRVTASSTFKITVPGVLLPLAMRSNTAHAVVTAPHWIPVETELTRFGTSCPLPIKIHFQQSGMFDKLETKPKYIFAWKAN